MNNIDLLIEKYLPTNTSRTMEAVRYSIFNSGKRLRPNFVIETAKLYNKDDENIERMAVAIEMIHTYSLIHDDLPCMDNDDFRRGEPTCHKKFDYATAVLAGDALLNLAFETLLNGKYSEEYFNAIKVFSEKSGINGMIGGQNLDIFEKINNLDDYLTMVNGKTSALFIASVVAPSIYCNATVQQTAFLEEFAKNFGILFQIADDIEDNIEFLDKFVTKDKLKEFVQYSLFRAKQCLTFLPFDLSFFNSMLSKIEAKLTFD